MTKPEFYTELEGILDAAPGTIKGIEPLESLEGWDSMSIVSFLAMADERLDTIVPAKALLHCKTVTDLMDLFPGKIF